jgi:hypothetical protein
VACADSSANRTGGSSGSSSSSHVPSRPVALKVALCPMRRQ